MAAHGGRVAVTAKDTVRLMVPRGVSDKITAKLVYTGPVRAPVARGTGHRQSAGLARRGQSARGAGPGIGKRCRGRSISQRVLDAASELVINLFRSAARRLKSQVSGPTQPGWFRNGQKPSEQRLRDARTFHHFRGRRGHREIDSRVDPGGPAAVVRHPDETHPRAWRVAGRRDHALHPAVGRGAAARRQRRGGAVCGGA